MNVREAVRGRRSIRKFLDRPVPDDIVAELIDALIWAPSAGNLQSRRFYFVRDERTKKQLATIALGQRFIAEAPLAVVCCTDADIRLRYGKRGTDLYAIQDVAASIMCMMLLAHERGLGSCWVGAFDEPLAAEILGLPEQYRPVAIVPVGYPERLPQPTPRVPRERAVEFR